MKKHWIAAGVVVLLAAVAAGAFYSGSRHRDHHRSGEHGPRMSLQGKSVIELGQAIELASTHLPGEVLKVELENEDGRFAYEVKVLATDGRVREVKLDAQDGSLIEIEDD
jgi:uncharacterized membrane protein YkoI